MKRNKSIGYIVLSIFMAFTVLTSCVDDDLLPSCDSDVPEEIRNGYSLSFIVTLDKMGGDNATRAGGMAAKELEEMENYIDPEKFRVLFFASDDNGTDAENIDGFLFESKGRWVKKLETGDGDHSSWFVSVPMFDFGNDVEYNWEWDKIREYLTMHNFKIAILANRPDLEWNMGITNKNDSKDTLTAYGWYDNTGPHWKQKNTIWGPSQSRKKIFDLHHCQYDPIYDGKNWDNTNLVYYGVYDFIADNKDEDGKVMMSKYTKHGDHEVPAMGATSTWVSWEGNDTQNKDPKNNLRHWIHPDKDHPIPMYGIQEFEPIPTTEWKKGTIYNLERKTENGEKRDKAISLLRSVVKLELLIPKGVKTNYVTVFYPNIYARCEPLDIWTPTDQIWKNDIYHTVTSGKNRCEWFDIIDYGVVTDGTEPTEDPAKNPATAQLSINAYQEKMCWFYGYWKERTDWPFGTLGRNNEIWKTHSTKPPYPRIFNTCVQRNTAVACVEGVNNVEDYADGYDHWVVYCGERNVNDPSNLLRMGQSGSGNATIIYWMISVENTSYAIPLINYEGITGPTLMNLIQPDGNPGNYVNHIPRKNGDTGDPNGIINLYERYVQGHPNGDPPKGFSDYTANTYPKPWPLLRNHVYRIKIDGIKTQTRAAGDGGLSIKSENLYSKSINFDKLKEEKERKVTENKKIEKE